MLKSQLVKKGYRIYRIPPTWDESYSNSAPEVASETQISYVDVSWMKWYRLTSTPTTLLFDGHGKLIWSHIGTMDKDDQKSAMQAGFLDW
jgi:thioredoxin-related protein